MVYNKAQPPVGDVLHEEVPLPPAFLQAIEQSAVSTWIRDSPSLFAFWFVISIHAIGMALLVGTSTIVDLRLLGTARDLPLTTLKRLYPALWAGFWLQLASGVTLLIAYPTKSFTSPAFYVKLACIAAAMAVMTRLRRRLPAGAGEAPMFAGGRSLAILSLVLWFVAITAGRLIAYTAAYSMYP
jgi:hypothetical protein